MHLNDKEFNVLHTYTHCILTLIDDVSVYAENVGTTTRRPDFTYDSSGGKL